MVPATLTIAVTPADAVVTVDDKPVTGGSSAIELTGGKKAIKVVAKASGYRTYEKKMTITGDSVVNIKMTTNPTVLAAVTVQARQNVPREGDRPAPGSVERALNAAMRCTPSMGGSSRSNGAP